jgi:outer membrane protein
MRNFALILLLFTTAGAAQTYPSSAPLTTNYYTESSAKPNSTLPETPVPQVNTHSPSPGLPGTSSQIPATLSGGDSANTANTLSISQAEQLALKNNPQISVARLAALASQQVTKEVRSALWPTAVADFTGVDSNDSRIAAGALNNPIIYERAAAGATVSQLITDFGRTSNLVSSAGFDAKAQDQNAVATLQQIRLAVDEAFYSALQAHSVARVAEQTVASRQAVADQIQALFNSKLKSQLDLSFANVNLAQAKLLLLDAQNNENATYAALSAVLGFSSLQNYRLVEDTTPITPPPANVDDLISDAFSKRPELLALNYEYDSARKFQTAERDLMFPTVRAIGVVGDVPVGNPALARNNAAFANWYGAVGANVEIPIFNGYLYSARAREATLKAQAADERLRDMRDRIARDVRTSWLNADAAYNRLAVSRQLLDESNLALDLAQTRYKLGLSSIVELSQAQLQQTQAEISNTQAGYDYRLALAMLRYQIASF